ncbi:MAG: SMI1/KNR4 family protein [Actinomycetia bacterium]|nr:SMI1/KNR4 family protein [Actinomycetes bacterium]
MDSVEEHVRGELARFNAGIGFDLPWSEPVSDEVIDQVADRRGLSIPEEVRVLYRIGDGGGFFHWDTPPLAELHLIDMSMRGMVEEIMEFEYPEWTDDISMGEAPQGELLFFGGHEELNLGIELDGPATGRLVGCYGKVGQAHSPSNLWSLVAPSISAWASCTADMADRGLFEAHHPPGRHEPIVRLKDPFWDSERNTPVAHIEEILRAHGCGEGILGWGGTGWTG